MDRITPQPGDRVVVDQDVIKKVSQENRVAVYRTLGLVIFIAAAAIIVAFFFSRSFQNTHRLDRAICVEIQFLDGIPNSNARIRKLVRDLEKVSQDCPQASTTQ